MPRTSALLAGLVFIATWALSPSAEAMVTPIGASVFPPFEFPMRDSSIIGARLNLFLGIHQSVYGFDLGLVGNMTDRAFGGLQFAGIFNRDKGRTSIYGAQVAGLVNWNLTGSDIIGLQATLGLNVNLARSTLVGVGVGGLGNRSPQSTVVGGQIGIFNQAKQVIGFQIGVVNMAQSLHGIQVGLININRSGPLPVLPIANIGF